MSMDYVRRTYSVPAKRGGRIKFEGKPGVITSARGGGLRIRLDGEKHSVPVHPTWEMEYEDAKAEPDAGPETEDRRSYAIVRGECQPVEDVYLPGDAPEETR